MRLLALLCIFPFAIAIFGAPAFANMELCEAFNTEERPLRDRIRELNEWLTFQMPNLRIEVPLHSSSKPEIQIMGFKKTLILPRPFLATATDAELNPWLKKLLVGHTIQPHLEHFIKPEIHSFPREALRAKIAEQTKTDRKLLFLSPDSSSRRAALTQFVAERIKLRPEGLHVVFYDNSSDAEALLNRLKVEIQSPFIIEKWDTDLSALSLGDLVDATRKVNKPVLLMTTARQFRKRFAVDYGSIESPASFLDLSQMLETIAYDDGHHPIDTQTRILLKALFESRDSHLLLFSSTNIPILQKTDKTELSWKDPYWAYLDDPSGNGNPRNGKASRPFENLMDQLSLAIDAGNLTPVDQVHLLLAHQSMENSAFKLSVDDKNGASRGSRYRLDPRFFDEIFLELRPGLLKHKHGIIVVGSKEEATNLTSYLERRRPAGRTYTARHFDLWENDIEVQLAFKSGEIDYLIVIRDFNESLNYPDVSFFIDLTHPTDMKPFARRLERFLEFSERKLSADVALLMDFDLAKPREALAFFEYVTSNKFAGGVRRLGDKRNTENANFGNVPSLMEKIRDRLNIREEFLNEVSFLSWLAENDVKSPHDFRVRFGQKSTRPANIPANPNVHYRKTWPDLIGSKPRAPRTTSPKTLDGFIQWAKENDIKSAVDFKNRFSSETRPRDIPPDPTRTYALKWSEILKRLEPDASTYAPEADFLKWLKEKKVLSEANFKIRFGKPESRIGIPAKPDEFYGMTWPAILKKIGIHQGPTPYASQVDFEVWAIANGVENEADFRLRFVKTRLLPLEFPIDPRAHYPDFRWAEYVKRRRAFL